MPEYLAPGVFVEEIDSGSKPIEGVGTNTAAFIGYAKSGEFNKPTFITNWTQFVQTYGEEENAVLRGLCAELGKSAAELVTAKKAARKSWMDYARLAVQTAIRDGSGTVRSWQEFLKKYNVPQGGLPYMDDSYLAHAVRGYYDNGGGRAYIVRVARKEDVEAHSLVPAGDTKALPAGAPAQVAAGGITFKALKPGPTGNDIKIEVEHVGDADEFKIKVTQGSDSETFGGGKGEKPLTPGTAAAAVNAKSKIITMEATATATRPDATVFSLTGGAEASANLPARAGATALTVGPATNGLANVRPDDFVGDEAQRTGLNGLAVLEDVNFVAAPDLMAGVWKRESMTGPDGTEVFAPEELALTDAKKRAILDAQCALVGFCERMGDRMAIIDPLPGLAPQEMRDVTLDTPFNCDHGQGTIYYPWIKIADPVHRGQQLLCPPSGHVAGVWTRVGVERGVHKAPANEALIGAVGLEVSITKGEQEILNPEGINCIRAFPGTGIRIWGARTLATVGNPSWKYVNVRRLFNYLEKSMERGMQWVVFEPNDEDLWGRVRRNLAAFLFTEWKEGKLFGSTPAEAFYVKCDAETNPQEMIDLGRLYVEIGVNPVKPAEFVIVRIGQWSGGGSMAEQ